MSYLRILTAIFAVAPLAAAPVFAQDDYGPYVFTGLGPDKPLPDEGRPKIKAAFPAISDWNTLKIKLTRSVCYGTCPSYSVEIGGDGTVIYDGDEFVAVPGTHRSHIPVDKVRELFAAFKKANFFWSLDEYTAGITDFPLFTLTLAYDGHTKTVSDYVGRAIGMPKAFTALENAIDTAAGTEKWIKGNDETIPALRAEGWDFTVRDEAHLSLIGTAAARGNKALLHRLVEAGTSPVGLYGCAAIGGFSSREADPETVAFLLASGAPTAWDAPRDESGRPRSDRSFCDSLAEAAVGGNPEIVRLILARHPDVNRRDWYGRTALMQVARDRYSGDPSRDYGAVIRLLLAAGADVNLRDTEGNNALMMIGVEADIVRALLKAGVKDINARNLKGETALMLTYDGEVAQALLEAGADPWLVNGEGKTALDLCTRTFGKDCGMADVLKRWMAAHPKKP